MTQAAAQIKQICLDLQTTPLVWVLAPSVETGDENVDYYYDFSQSIQEYEKVFSELNLNWRWQPVTMKNYESVIHEIAEYHILENQFPIVLNLCDGDEVNGAPGISVIRCLEQYELVYTGANTSFYEITTSKIPMKKAFDEKGVSNAAWSVIQTSDENWESILQKTGTPLIVKPAVSGGSMGVGIKNVVNNSAELKQLTEDLLNGYRGWNLMADGLVAESFISGREFTVLISGSCHQPEFIRVYDPVERVFHPSLPDKEKFLSFDRLWEIYETESAMPESAHFYEYSPVDKTLAEEIKKISLQAFLATGGTGYARADIRMDQNTGQLYMLEINAQCGISEDENYTSIGAILKFSNQTFSELVAEIITDGYRRALLNHYKIHKS